MLKCTIRPYLCYSSDCTCDTFTLGMRSECVMLLWTCQSHKDNF